jgi:hypothetical protein
MGDGEFKTAGWPKPPRTSDFFAAGNNAAAALRPALTNVQP